MVDQTIRAFIAFPLNEAKLKIKPIIENLKNEIPGNEIKWVEVQNLHITLKFLGDINQQKLQNICQELKNQLSPLPLLNPRIINSGVFPNYKKPNTIWLGIEPANIFDPFVSQVELICEKHGFARENRPFSPHITIGRVRRETNSREKISAVIKKFEKIESIPLSINQIVIYKSTLTRTGPIYTPFHIVE